MWMRPEDAVDGLSGKFWATTTGLTACWGTMVDLGGVFCPLGGLIGAPGVMAGTDGLLGHG